MVLLKSDMGELGRGDKAPDFKIKNVDGKMVSLKDFKGIPVAIIFMCNHCPYVVPKMDEIKELQDMFKDRVKIICVSSNDVEYEPADSFENMQRLAEEKGYEYYLFDESQDMARSYGAVCTPDPFLFDKDHNLVFHGRINNAMNPHDQATKHDLREAISKMLKGEQVNEWFVPSMGCSIKWKE
jgi:peroxiredoxin